MCLSVVCLILCMYGILLIESISIFQTDLVDKLLHPCLQSPHLKLNSHQLVGAHDGFLALNPALLQ